LLIALAEAAAERFAPVSLLSLLKHPLVRKGEGRLDWLEGARALDLALRGPRPPAGLQGVSDFLADWSGRDAERRKRAGTWWRNVRQLLSPLDRTFSADRPTLASLMAALRETASLLSGDQIWAGPAGRAAADLFAATEPAAPSGPRPDQARQSARLARSAAERRRGAPAFRPASAIFIWGLLEARLQSADLMILAGLNEGTWPALPTPDPWLAPRLRHELGLPSLERRIGLAAHDFACALGGREVLVTRGPPRCPRRRRFASRFWLRLEAMTGGLTRAPQLKAGRRRSTGPAATIRPSARSLHHLWRAPAQDLGYRSRPAQGRPFRLLCAQDAGAVRARSDRRRSKPRLARHRGPCGAEAWMRQDACDPAQLRPRAEKLLADTSAHPLLRALWEPRLLEAIDWIAQEVARNSAAGRLPLKAEATANANWVASGSTASPTGSTAPPTARSPSSTIKRAKRRAAKRCVTATPCSSACWA
jgi:ATP-dependent helicase/nuclease subunit B